MSGVVSVAVRVGPVVTVDLEGQPVLCLVHPVLQRREENKFNRRGLVLQASRPLEYLIPLLEHLRPVCCIRPRCFPPIPAAPSAPKVPGNHKGTWRSSGWRWLPNMMALTRPRTLRGYLLWARFASLPDGSGRFRRSSECFFCKCVCRISTSFHFETSGQAQGPTLGSNKKPNYSDQKGQLDMP